MFENIVLGRIYGHKREEIAGGWRKLHNTVFHKYIIHSILLWWQNMSVRSAVHVEYMGRWDTNSLEHSTSWEAISPLTSQDFPAFMISECSLTCSRGSHTLLCFVKIYFNIILCTHRSSKWPLSFRYFDQKVVCIFHTIHACCTPPQFHNFRCDVLNNMWRRVQSKMLDIIFSLAFLSLRSS